MEKLRFKIVWSSQMFDCTTYCNNEHDCSELAKLFAEQGRLLRVMNGEDDITQYFGKIIKLN